jgi:hypothetical protein
MSLPEGYTKRWPGGGLRFPGRVVGSKPGVYTPQDGDPLYLDNIQYAAVSSSDESSGYLSNTNYRIESGSWRVQAGNYIDCIAGGQIWRRNQHAYSTHRVGLYKVDLSLVQVLFVDEDKTISGAGYRLEMPSTEQVNLVQTGVTFLTRSSVGYVAPLTRYDFIITREDSSPAGQFYTYIKGGSYTNWQLLDSSAGGSNPVTNNAITTSKYLVFDLDAGDRIYCDRQFIGVIPPI